MWLPFTRRTASRVASPSLSFSTCFTQGPAALTTARARTLSPFDSCARHSACSRGAPHAFHAHQDARAARGGIETLRDHQPRVVHAAVREDEAVLQLAAQSRAIRRPVEPHRLRPGQQGAARQVVVEEQPDADHPARPQLRHVRHDETQRPGEVAGDAQHDLALGERFGHQAELGSARDSAGRRAPASRTPTRWRRARSSRSTSSTDSPRPAASRAMPAPLMPPPITSRSWITSMRGAGARRAPRPRPRPGSTPRWCRRGTRRSAAPRTAPVRGAACRCRRASRIEIIDSNRRVRILSGSGGPWLATVSAAVPAGVVERHAHRRTARARNRPRSPPACRAAGRQDPARPRPRRAGPPAAARARRWPADRRGGSPRRSRAPPRARSKRSRSSARRLCSRREASVMRSRIRFEPREALLGALDVEIVRSPWIFSGFPERIEPPRSACAARARGARPCSRGRNGARRAARAPPRSCAKGRRSRRRAPEPASRVTMWPRASIADSASSRRRRMRMDRRVANAISTMRGAGEGGEGQQQQALERGALHRHHRIGGLFGHHRAGDLVAAPDRVRGRHDHGARRRACGACASPACPASPRPRRRRSRARPRAAPRRNPRSGAESASPERAHRRLPPRRLGDDVDRALQAARRRDAPGSRGRPPRCASEARCRPSRIASTSSSRPEALASSCGRSCSAVATARATASSDCSCPSSRKRSTSFTYRMPA